MECFEVYSGTWWLLNAALPFFTCLAVSLCFGMLTLVAR
jgi:hypothetical protein